MQGRSSGYGDLSTVSARTTGGGRLCALDRAVLDRGEAYSQQES